MAIDIKFNLVGNPEPPTIILANRNGNKLGQLYVNEDSIDLSDKLNAASEFSFTMNKYVDGKITNLWDKVVDFKLVYCKEWDMWFEIKVELDEDTETIKTVFCTQLGYAELSQIMLYDIEINTEADIERDDYKISILYDKTDPESSILMRLLDKAPHYSVIHVDPTIAGIQRSFSFNDTSICDAFQKISEEIGCLFVYNSNSDENGKIQRTISVYDLQQNCNDCGHRGEYTDKCPKCGSSNITYGYGEDTTIFVTSDELASDGIQLVTDVDSVKNCFKLEAGDDLMTATIRNCNPNGSDYIWYFSSSLREDMSSELVQKLDEYNEKYRYYYNEYVSNIDSNLLSKYNSLVTKYSTYNKDLQKIEQKIVGYPALMNAYYNAVDLSLYLESGLMPDVNMSDTTAQAQANLLTASSLSPIAVANASNASLATVDSATLAMAKAIVRSTYRVQVETSEIIENEDSKTWKGNFSLTNYSDEEDVATSKTISVSVTDDLETSVKQKLDKALAKENTEDLSISGLFDKEYDDFCAELKKYALNPLISIHDACQACIDILIEQGVADKNTWADTDDENAESNLYEKLYVPYYDKLMAIESEMKVREDELKIINGSYDMNGNLTSKGVLTEIEGHKNKIQKELDFENCLGHDLWLEFCTYRREDKYTNENYISDGLNNTELFNRALEFIESAENEIYKSAELQHSISTTLNNLLAIPKFKPLVNSFKVGNWIRVQVDDYIYKLRLLEYEIGYGNFKNIPVEFSDVTKAKNGITDLESVLSQASSMSTSYDEVQRQASQGNQAKGTISDWIKDGLNSALVQIQSNDSEEITLTKNGLLCRSYDDVTDSYLPEQLKLTHNIMAYTDDDWQSVRQAIGKHKYVVYDENEDKFVSLTGYGINADFVTAGVVSGSQIIGGDVYSDNYSLNDNTGSYINLRDGTFNFGGGRIVFNGEELKISSPDMVTEDQVTEIAGNYIKTANIYAENLEVGAANIKGKLVADQIDTTNLKVGVENIDGALTDGDIPTKLSDLINDVGFQNADGVTSIVGGIVTTDYVSALGITVEAAHINGTLKASQIDAAGLIAENISASDLKGKNILGGYLLIGDENKVDSYAEITQAGILSCINAHFSGSITGSAINGSSFTSMNNHSDGVVIHSGEQDFYFGNAQVGSIYTGMGAFSIGTNGGFDMWVYSDRHLLIDAPIEQIESLTSPSIVIGNGGKNIYLNGNVYVNGVRI